MDEDTKLCQNFGPMDGDTYTVERQTKTYVPKYVCMFLPARLWTRPKAGAIFSYRCWSSLTIVCDAVDIIQISYLGIMVVLLK